MTQNCPDSDSNCPESGLNCTDSNLNCLNSDSNCPQNYSNCPESDFRGKRKCLMFQRLGKDSLKAVQTVIWSSVETLSDLQCYKTSVQHFYNPKDCFLHELVLNWELEFTTLAATHLLIQLKR